MTVFHINVCSLVLCLGWDLLHECLYMLWHMFRQFDTYVLQSTFLFVMIGKSCFLLIYITYSTKIYESLSLMLPISVFFKISLSTSCCWTLPDRPIGEPWFSLWVANYAASTTSLASVNYTSISATRYISSSTDPTSNNSFSLPTTTQHWCITGHVPRTAASSSINSIIPSWSLLWSISSAPLYFPPMETVRCTSNS